jgi:two-component system, LytTR family, sensor histidine kinase AgrC
MYGQNGITKSIGLLQNNRKVRIVVFMLIIVLFLLTAVNTLVSYYTTMKAAEVSIASQGIEMAKAIAQSLDKKTYKQFLKKPSRNEHYWKIRSYLNEARMKTGALYVYTVLVENEKIARGMIIGLPKEVGGFPIGEICLIPPPQVALAYQGKTYFTEIINDPKYGKYLSVGAPIIENGQILGYVGIDMSVEMIDNIKKKVLKNSVSTFFLNGVLLLLLLLGYTYLQKWYQREIHKAVGAAEETYQDEMQSFLTTVRSIRHDFLNHIQVIQGLLQMGYYEKALEYLKRLTAEIKVVDLPIELNNPALKVLFHTKWVAAQNERISFTIDVDEDSYDGIHSTDLIKLLSNLLDNAIEATIEMPVEKRRIKVVCKKIKNFYHFEVQNTGKTIAETELNNIFKSGYSTKAVSKGKVRGFGLAIVKGIVEQYRGSIEVESMNGQTIFRIILPAKK